MRVSGRAPVGRLELRVGESGDGYYMIDGSPMGRGMRP